MLLRQQNNNDLLYIGLKKPTSECTTFFPNSKANRITTLTQDHVISPPQKTSLLITEVFYIVAENGVVKNITFKQLNMLILQHYINGQKKCGLGM
jgi:hypothetical protein